MISSTSAPEVDNPSIIFRMAPPPFMMISNHSQVQAKKRLDKELIDNMTNAAVEAGSDLCEICCGDDDSAPSPVESFTTSPSSTTAKLLSILAPEVQECLD
jgi:hypothetical protein